MAKRVKNAKTGKPPKPATKEKTAPAATTAAPDNKVKPGDLKKVPAASVLDRLLKIGRSSAKDSAEANGRFGSAVAKAVEDHALHRKAFRVLVMASKMEPEKLADFLDHLEHYFEATGIYDRANTVQGLPLNKDDDAERQEADAGAEQPQPEQQQSGDDNVHHLGTAARKVAEAAGAA